MGRADATVLTDRQIEVLELREQGYTQKEVAQQLGTTGANISAIERAAEDNIEKAKRTIDLVRTLRSPTRFEIPAGTDFGRLIELIYLKGDEAGTKVEYLRPELYTHLYSQLKEHMNQSRLNSSIEVGITHDGDVDVYIDES